MKAVRFPRIQKLFSDSHILIFAQFLLILLTLITLMLFTSSSFYKSMLENVTSFSLQDAASELDRLDYSSESIIQEIHKIELDKFVFIEVYSSDTEETKKLLQSVSEAEKKMKENGETNSKELNELSDRLLMSYRKPVFMQYNYSRFFDKSISSDSTIPFINYTSGKFEQSKRYTPTVQTGNFTDAESGYTYYMMRTVSKDGKLLYLIVVHEALISAQAKAITIAVSFILLVTFILIAIIGYLYITRVTKPLKDIRDVTKAMAETNDTTIRIPTRQKVIKTETDETISSVNYLYERLILTQESLKEKTDFLSSQLSEVDAERKFREEFIASSSHELKTPITIIQGYAEGIQYSQDDPETVNFYCKTIIEECMKMTNLVVNMMSLSKLQHTNKLKFQDFSIKDFIEERMKLYDKIFEKHGISAENQIKDDIWGSADLEKLPFVINNLISNAVSYIGGEKKVTLRYKDMGLSYRIFVYNTGSRIPRAELEKLWESFYRQDFARERSGGHFGLGLSIVKSVQDAHSQACGVDNAKDGVEFWFDIMKKEKE